ncbi:FAD-dependent oxidoreductase [Bordetella bronchiseptica]|uniref:FAD-monooxygenase n=3 Tax=Bordetella bronchiseptica TaxID=518 RepID=A0A0H3LHW6_BORBR|nr:FAD-dependent oxidoreductase [Bordetella bronchiseptica]KAK68235.1 FAD binding domain protein [Bordetella bronchiseptica 980-2]SHS20460.1 FAD-binding monooxygenase [Mycobacteroides abscessus subsp. abscessus]AMG87253.1 monooxygenase [Bordetella bronchiseptica]AWP78420.1 monooxygenase [Bordetella bronchiseptica]AWP83235.1 monooxygenase [Bordetella bronchiseptica]
MGSTEKHPVIVVGAGPVGLTVAMDMASRGVSVLVLERRHRGEAPSVKCNHVSARSMEVFRRLGVAQAVRAAGLPDEYPHDVAYRTSATGIELTRIPIPGRAGRQRKDTGPDTNWPTMEPPHRINQIYLEPILFEHAAGMERIAIRNRVEVTEIEQDDEGVTVHARDLDSGESLRMRADYLVGCDGGRSAIRTAIGAKLVGDAVIQRVQSSYIRAPQLRQLFKHEPAWATFTLNPARCGNMYAIDGKELWLVHNYLRDEEPDFESVDRDLCIRRILGVGEDFEYELISKEDWYGRRLVADRFRDRRVFICGDAAHLWVPYAGYGMNAGIADAANLAWLLAATVNGWADARILDAYVSERHPITSQVSYFVMDHAHAMATERRIVPENIEAQDEAGAAVRAQVGERAYALNVQQYCCAGLNFGYFYDQSPLIAYDGESQPAYTMGDFTPSTVPGCRTPHFQLADGASLYDAMGDGYTVLRLKAGVDVQPLVEAAARRGMPLRVLDLEGEDAPPAYRHALVISRPDQHVAWRGDTLPADPQALVDQLRGAA